jgi:hypothetical protein
LKISRQCIYYELITLSLFITDKHLRNDLDVGNARFIELSYIFAIQ